MPKRGIKEPSDARDGKDGGEERKMIYELTREMDETKNEWSTAARYVHVSTCTHSTYVFTQPQDSHIKIKVDTKCILHVRKSQTEILYSRSATRAADNVCARRAARAHILKRLQSQVVCGDDVDENASGMTRVWQRRRTTAAWERARADGEARRKNK